MNDIQHDEKNQEFYIETPEGKALLSYEKKGVATLDFHHTFVPPELRGKGIAEKIVAEGFDYAAKNNLKVIPSCPYVARLVMKNPDWKKSVVFS